MEKADESWKPIPNEPGYEISSWGRCRSAGIVDRGRWGISNRGARILRGLDNGRGYVQYSLGRRRKAYAHRLVAEAFLPSGHPEQVTVNHLDGNKQNNHVSNLERASQKEQVTHSIKTGLAPDRSKFDATLKRCLQVLCEKYSQGSLAQVFDVSQQTLSDWKRGSDARREKATKTTPAGD